MSELQKELRIGNLIYHAFGQHINETISVTVRHIFNCIDHPEKYKPIPLTKENIEKYIDWSFELNFNKSVQQYEEWTTHWYLLENIIDGTSDFTIDFRINNKDSNLSFVDFYLDDKHLEFGLDDTLHNLQNLFFISSGQELPIKNQ